MSAGYYILLAPLSVGEHTVRFHYGWLSPEGIADITYHIAVAPKSVE
jgi:hypothetical protein